MTNSPSVESATRRELERLEALDSALGAVALTLAKALDDGAGMAAAAVSKELRATLKELTPRDGGDPFAQFMASLSSPVRDPETAGAPDPRL